MKIMLRICLHAIPVVDACDMTPPDIAKKLGIDLSHCPYKATFLPKPAKPPTK